MRPIERRSVRKFLGLLALGLSAFLAVPASSMAQPPAAPSQPGPSNSYEFKVGEAMESLTNGVVPNTQAKDFAARLEEAKKKAAELDTERSSRQLDARSLVPAL